VIINQRIAPIQAIQAENSRLERIPSKRHNPFIFIALAVALLVSLTQVGCTGLTSANGTAPADPTSATTVAVAGATGTFGSVGTGTSLTQTFTVTNTGSTMLNITQLAASGSGFSVSGFTLPITVNPGQGTSFIAKFAPTTTGAVTGSISMTANTNPAVSTIMLSGTGTSSGQPMISIQPTSVSFGGVGLGQNVGQQISITNLGSGVLTISNISVAGAGFSVSGVSGPITLAAGQATTVVANIDTMNAGTIAGSITFSNNSSTPSVVIPLSGAGMSSQGQPAITVSPTSVNFGGVDVGQSVGQAMSITNSGSGTLTISNIAVAGSSFSMTGVTLPINLTAGQATNFVAKIDPTTTGNLSGSLTITNNSSTSSVVVPLSGSGMAQGQPAIGVNPASVSFGNVTVGAPNSQTILIQNNGSATLSISQLSAFGAGFSVSGLAIPATIAAGSSTIFNIAFSPASPGAVLGSVSLASNAASSPLAIPLSGTGVASTLLLGASTSTVAFGSVAVGSNSSQSVTLTNNGNSTVTIGTVSAGTGFSASGVTAGQMIGAGQTATLAVTFTPGSVATVSGTVAVTSNATNSPISISLSGTGTQAVAHSVSLSWTASTSTVVGYNVYRSAVSGGPYTLITTSSPTPGTTYTDTGVQAGMTYFYVVTAVDSNGNESAFSNEAPVTVPTP
jgi:hypothetical protein